MPSRGGGVPPTAGTTCPAEAAKKTPLASIGIARFAIVDLLDSSYVITTNANHE